MRIPEFVRYRGMDEWLCSQDGIGKLSCNCGHGQCAWRYGFCWMLVRRMLLGLVLHVPVEIPP